MTKNTSIVDFTQLLHSFYWNNIVYDKGLTNIAIAFYLEKDLKREIENYKNIKTCNGLCVVSSDINHIIIGRFYYGIYLIAKSKLGYKNDGYAKHKSNKQKKIDSVWCELANHYDDNFRCKIITYGENLAKKRERFEYKSYKCCHEELQLAKEYFNYIYRILKDETYT